MFDPREYMKDRTLIDPVEVDAPAHFPREEYVPEGCTVLENLADDWGYRVHIHTGIVYAERGVPQQAKDEVPLHMNIFEPKLSDGTPFAERDDETRRWPCIVYVQGSAFHSQRMWYNTSRHIRMAEHGYVVAVVQYRPSETAPFPAQAMDVKTAIRYLRRNADIYHIDPEHMAIAGDSSGGHTALMVGFTGDDEPDTPAFGEYSAKVNCIVDVYAPTVFSLMNYWPSAADHHDAYSVEGYEIGVRNVLDHPDEGIPMNYLSEEKQTPPTLIIAGGRDMIVPFTQSCFLYEYMKKMGKNVTMYKIKDAGHGVLGFNNDTVMNIVLDFLKANI